MNSDVEPAVNTSADDPIGERELFPGNPVYDAYATSRYFKKYPTADYQPAAVGKDVLEDQRANSLLWNNEDMMNAFNDVKFAMRILGLHEYDDEIQHIVDAGLECIADLHQFGRTTVPGLGIGVLRTVLRVDPTRARYFHNPETGPRQSNVIKADIKRLSASLKYLLDELEVAERHEASSAK